MPCFHILFRLILSQIERHPGKQVPALVAELLRATGVYKLPGTLVASDVFVWINIQEVVRPNGQAEVVEQAVADDAEKNGSEKSCVILACKPKTGQR